MILMRYRASDGLRAGAQRSLPIPATLQSCVAARSFLGLSGAVHGYEPRSPYHRVDASSSGEPATRGNHAM